MFHFFYALPLPTAICMSIVAVFCWAVLCRIFRKYTKQLRLASLILFCFSILLILKLTIFNREPGDFTACFVPFYSLVEAKVEREIYRSSLMNIFLFMPYGMTLPFVISSKRSKRIIVTILSALILSGVIEFIQYKFSLGRCETDDVICNSIGAAMGTISYLLYSMKFQIKNCKFFRGANL